MLRLGLASDAANALQAARLLGTLLVCPLLLIRSSFATDPEAPPAGLGSSVVAIGNFDGVHRGHQAVIARAKTLADELGKPCAVLTFEPHPADVFAGRPTIFRLTPLPAKALALARLGTVDGMFVRSFDRAFATLSAEEFVAEILVARLGISAAVVGYDFHFGKGRSGSPDFLVDAGRRHGFRVCGHRQDPGRRSRHPRRRLLDRDPELNSSRQCPAGRRSARTRLFRARHRCPRAEARPHPGLSDRQHRPRSLVALAHGIYAVRVAMVEGASFGGVASFGRRPTFDDGAPLLEAYLFDFEGDLYGQTIEIDFIDWIRGEEKFGSAEALVERMRRRRSRCARKSSPHASLR